MEALDHVVFNTQDRMEEALALFGRLGFTVSPRGFHTLGSINHTIVFGSDYLELLGYPPGKPPEKRPELLRQPVGLMATVLNTVNADATHARLLLRGLRPRQVQAFSRPVDLGGGRIEDAAFRVTRLEPDAVPGTWFYYCQQLTPHLVWRPQWQTHANGALAISALEIAVPDLAAALPGYRACLLGDEPESIGGSGSWAEFSITGSTIRLRMQPGSAKLLGLTFRVASIDQVQQLLMRAKVRFDLIERCVSVDPTETLGAKLQFQALAR